MTPKQGAQVLRLYHGEGVSIAVIAAMTGLGRALVTRVLRETREQGLPVVAKASGRRPSSKSRIERQLQAARARSLREGRS